MLWYAAATHLLLVILLCDNRIAVYTWDSYPGAVPIPPDMEGVVGVHVGCVATHGTGLPEMRADAHAHIAGPYRGWACFGEKGSLNDRRLRLHETAHILTGQGHTLEWETTFHELLAER